jgi:hypothetical protein
MKFSSGSFAVLSMVVSLSGALAGVPEMRPEPRKFQKVCSDMMGDGGYAVIFAPDGNTAEVQANNIAGAETVAKLSCPLDRKPAPCCDRVSTTVCVDEQNRSGGESAYKITLRSGGLTGRSDVELHRGGAKVAQLPCKLEQVQ